MEPVSRTSRSIRNIVTALAYYCVATLLAFVGRRVFIDRLGADVLGLNTTAVNLMQFLNLAEFGIGLAVGYALYAPVARGDRRVIAEIIALQGHLYRRIAFVIIGGAVILGCFFPLIFKGMSLPLWYAYASFGVLLFSALLSYFVNYRQVIMTVSQCDYRIKYSYNTALIVKTIVQIWAVYALDNPYVWWLVIEAAGAVGAAVALDLSVRRHYPYLSTPQPSRRELMARYPHIVADTRRLFIHRIADYVLRQTSPLVIYACVSLSMVAYYGNYMLVVTGLLGLLDAALAPINPAVGDLVASGDRERVRTVFAELFTLRFFCAASTTMILWLLLPPLVTLWLGAQYVLPPVVLALICAIYFINSFRQAIDAFKLGCGLFADVWAAVAEAVLNIGLSVLFGIIWGLPGILAGVLVALSVIVMGWKPVYVCRSGVYLPLRYFWGLFARHLPAVAVTGVALWLLVSVMPSSAGATAGYFLLYSIAVICVSGIVMAGVLWFTVPAARLVAGRLKTIAR